MTTLRRAGVGDAADLTRLRTFMLDAMGRDLSDPGWTVVCERALARRLAQPELFAAWLVECDGRAVSGGVGWIEEHLPSPGTPDGRRGHVASMSTEPEHRRRGYGRLVFGALMGWFGEIGVPRIDLRATETARPLYEDFGFRVLGGATMAWAAPGTPGPGLRFTRAD